MPEITETKLKEQIAKEQIGSLYFLYGDEKLLVRRNLNRLLKKLDGNFPEFNFQEFPHDAPVDSIADAVVAMPFNEPSFIEAAKSVIKFSIQQ